LAIGERSSSIRPVTFAQSWHAPGTEAFEVLHQVADGEAGVDEARSPDRLIDAARALHVLARVDKDGITKAR